MRSREALITALEQDKRFEPATGFVGVFETKVDGISYAVSPEVDINGRSVKVVASLPNTSGTLRPGLFARVNLKLETIENTMMLQEEAIVLQGNAQLVYILEDGKVSIKPVITGIRERGRVQIMQGVKAGDIVVTAGQMKLRPGAAAMPINLQTEKPQPKQSQ